MVFIKVDPLIVDMPIMDVFGKDKRASWCGLYKILCAFQKMFSNLNITCFRHYFSILPAILSFQACWNYKYLNNFCQVYPENKQTASFFGSASSIDSIGSVVKKIAGYSDSIIKGG